MSINAKLHFIYILHAEADNVIITLPISFLQVDHNHNFTTTSNREKIVVNASLID